MKFLILILLALSLEANITQKMFQLYQNREYKKACRVGFNNFNNHKRDETYISLYAFSCLKSDYIDRLSQAITTLKFSPESRKNAAYFATILMQKKLLYYSLVDGYKLSAFQLPTTDYILSKVFDLYSKSPQQTKEKVYIFQDPKDSKRTYKLYTIQSNQIKKIVIEEYYNNIKLNSHIYW